MTNKILKKIVGVFDYKLVEKNLIKNNRLIHSKSILNLNLILKKIFDNQKIKCLIQIGANDGSRFDELNIFISNIIIGGEKTPTIAGGKGFINENKLLKLEIQDITRIGNGILIKYSKSKN